MFIRAATQRAFLIAIVCCAPAALSQSPADRLVRFFKDVRTLQAIFIQQVFDEKGELVQRSTGKVQLMRPGRFRWEYDEPDPQLILADGEKLWIYDPELEQATVERINDALGAAPIALLIDQRSLEEQFTVEPARPSQRLEWVELIPKIQDIEFNRIKLGIINKGGLSRMILHDHFGQTTVIRLQNVRINQKIDSSKFEFDPPKGTDVINAAG